MKIAIVGSRDYPQDSYGLLWNYLQALPNDTVIVSGGARGIDLTAEHWAQNRLRLTTEIHRADWEHLGKSAGFVRNRTLVERADKVVAFWDGKSRGTAHSIRLAKQLRKPVEIHYPDGSVERFNQFQLNLG